jgi:hypothetical protein
MVLHGSSYRGRFPFGDPLVDARTGRSPHGGLRIGGSSPRARGLSQGDCNRGRQEVETILKPRPEPVAPFSLAVEDTASNQLAWVNSILSLQGTLMSAQRTAVTLIAFGLTLSQG